MPIFEYVCMDCKKRFEALVYGASQPKCPLCNSVNLDQQISVFSVRAGGAAGSPAPVDCPNAAACGAGRT
jgi:putative FmdB family regulatory protein